MRTASRACGASVWLTAIALAAAGGAAVGAEEIGKTEFVRVSPTDSRYFELVGEGGRRPYIPVGFNLVSPPEAEELAQL